MTARTTSLHGSANEFLTFEADAEGNFSRKVTVPFAGENEGGVIVHCDDTRGGQIDVFRASVEYHCPPDSKSRGCPAARREPKDLR